MISMMCLAYLPILQHLLLILVKRVWFFFFSCLVFSSFCPMPKPCSLIVHGLLFVAFIFVASSAFFLVPHAVSIALKPYLYADTGKYTEVFAVGMFLCMIYTYTHNSSSVEYWNSKIRRLSPLILTVGLVLLFFLSLWHFYFIDTNPL